MKKQPFNRLLLCGLAAVIVSLVALVVFLTAPLSGAEEKKVEHLSMLDNSAFTSLMVALPLYNRVTVAGWIELRGKDGKDSQAVTIADQGCFAVADTTIVVTHEPVVTKRADGKWEIAFK